MARMAPTTSPTSFRACTRSPRPRHPPDDPERTRGFLATTLRNVLAGRGRGERRRRAHETAAREDRADSSPSAAELVAQAELHQALGKLLLELPEPQREIMLRRHQREQAVPEIAHAVGRKMAALGDRRECHTLTCPPDRRGGPAPVARGNARCVSAR